MPKHHLCCSNHHAITWNAMKFGTITPNWSWGIHHIYKIKTSLPCLLLIPQADRSHHLFSLPTEWLHRGLSSTGSLHHICPQRNLARCGWKHNWKLPTNTNTSLTHIRQICELQMSRGFLAYSCLNCTDPEETYWPTFQGGLEKCNPNIDGKSDSLFFIF